MYRVPSGDAGDDLRKSQGQYEPPDFKREYECGIYRELMEKRRPRYEAVADICVDTDGKDVDAISEEILKAVEDRS